MVKHFTILVTALLLGMAMSAQTWVSFGKNQPTAPEFSVINSNDQKVVFTMDIYGMFVETKIEGSQTFKRLSLPECGVAGDIGSPELPVALSRLIAVPECDNIVYSVTVTGSHTLTNYLVYPVPDRDDEGEEVFVLNTGVYSQNALMPATDHQVSNTGHLRAQRFTQLTLNPLRYNPATQTLTVATQMEVTLTFVNAVTPINANLGIFSNVAANSFLNYENKEGITAAINDLVFAQGDEEMWENETPRGEYIEIDTRSGVIPYLPVDYMVIASAAFILPNGNPHPELMELIRHRMSYNGFNTTCVPVEWIISDELGLPYEGEPNPEFKTERRIRTFIRMVYEQQSAPHTYDGHLGYVLLVGEVGAGNIGMPGSYDHIDNAGLPPGHHERYPSDYYYSCVTRTNGVYDDVGDLYIGRLSVANDLGTGSTGGLTLLKNMIEKTIYHEKEYPFATWRNNVALATGVKRNGGTVTNEWVNYNNDLAAYYHSIAQNQGITHVNAHANLSQYSQNLTNAINNGVGLVTLFNMGSQTSLDDINVPQLKTNMPSKKAPFGIFISSGTGAIDGVSLAKDLTTYSNEKGFVAMLAPARSANMSIHTFANMPKGYQCYVPQAIYSHLSTITGECTLEAKLKVGSEKYRYNLTGDPALNIMAQGFEVTRDIVLEPYTEISSWLKVYGNVTVPNNGTIYIKDRGRLYLYTKTTTMGNNAVITGMHPMDGGFRLYIYQGAKLIGNANSKVTDLGVYIRDELVSNINFFNAGILHKPDDVLSIISSCSFNNAGIEIRGVQPDVASSWECRYTNCSFNGGALEIISPSAADPPFITNFSYSNFSNFLLYGEFHKLIITNCSFTNRSDIVSGHNIVHIKNCNFLKSGVSSVNTSKYHGDLIPEPNPFNGYKKMTPYTSIKNCTFKHTGTYIGEYYLYEIFLTDASINLKTINNFDISNNAINVYGKGLPPDEPPIQGPSGIGIKLFSAGNGSANNQRIQSNEIRGCETGLEVYNSKAQVYGNEIYENNVGVRLFNNSQTAFMGYDGIIGFCGYQTIRDNGHYEVYATRNALPAPFIYNQIIDEDNTGISQNDPLFYYDFDKRGEDPNQPHMVMNLSCNYWGNNFVHNDDIYPASMFATSPIWDPQTGECGGKGRGLYDDGMEYFENEDFTAAKSAFVELVATYPNDPFTIAALHQIFALEQFLDNDYATLHNYYASFTPADSTLFDVADFLATRCNVIAKNWQPAIDWYEDRIEDPLSYQDSVFAVIDLGDIHLMMENDSLKSARVFRFPNIKPKSRQQYEENKSALLATLPKLDQPRPQHPLAGTGKKGVLSQNIPNPATKSTSILYNLIEEGSVHLRIYNQLGQLLQDLPQGTQKPGSYRLEVSLVGMPAGVYHYVLFVEGEKADGKKLIVN